MNSEPETIRYGYSLPKVLLVDDDEEVLSVLKETLENGGFEVRTANDGLTAKMLVGIHLFEAVISDVKMPGNFNGLDLLKYMQTTHPKVPVVLMSGFGLETEKACRIGGGAFLAKPFRREALLAALKNDCKVQLWGNRFPSATEVNLKIQSFLSEITAFTKTTEDTLFSVNSEAEIKREAFKVFSNKMLAIRGTAETLGLPVIAKIARLSEELSGLAVDAAESRALTRKCVASLWDALTMVKYLLEHNSEETGAEQDILVSHLLSTLASLGGARFALKHRKAGINPGTS